MIEIDESTLDTIIEAKKNNKLAFFIGAGFSKNAETEYKKIPLWSDLIEVLKKSLDAERENDFLKIAQLYYLKYGEYQYFNKLKQYFDVDFEPSKVHKKLFDLLPNLIVTTNWDCLLEQTAFEQGLTYDVLVSDIDLVKSTYFHKILKMHGDFKHHNIVFKEDDYLKYSDNFPLIENYLKSILSTHVVVFLGYSYSDVDLKLITKWIETRSAVTPPKFLFTTRYNEAESSYLKNHGINLLVPENTVELGIDEILMDFFDLINQKNELYRFNCLLNKSELNDKEKIILVDFFYKKIKVLEELNSIFPIQIKQLFSNIQIDNHIGCYGLYFITDSVLTLDYDENYRKYYSVLHKIFLEAKEGGGEVLSLVKRVFFIFNKANIVFLKFKSDVQKDDYINIGDYIELNGDFYKDSYLDFESKGVANDLMFADKTSEIYDTATREIKTFIKDKLFIKLAISSFNANIANLDNKLKVVDKLTMPEREVKNFKDYFDFYNLVDKSEYKFINDFLNFNVLENIYFTISERATKNLKAIESSIKGGISFDVNRNEADLLIKSYLDFIYKNNIAMESYSSTKSLFNLYSDYKIKSVLKSNVKIDLDKKFLSFKIFTSVRLNKLDLFILLNFSNKDNIKNFIKSVLDLIKSNDELNLEDLFDSDFNLKKYLKSCFNNLLKKENSNYIEYPICNLIMLSSLADWTGDEDLIEYLKQVFVEYQSYNVIDSINSFVAFNSKFYEKFNIDFTPYVDLVIRSIVDNKINGFGYNSIQYGSLSNIFNYMSWSKNYSNKALVEELIYFLKSPRNPNKVFYTLKILPYLLYISNKELKTQIYKYLSEFLDSDINDDKFEIFLMCLNYDDDFWKVFDINSSKKAYIDYFDKILEEKNAFRFIDYQGLVIHLSKKKNKIYDLFRELVRKHNLNL